MKIYSPQIIGDTTLTGSLDVTSNITASNLSVTGLATLASASITYLETIYETASVIYSSGSNQFGDASNDVQTMYGTVDLKNGPLRVSGSTILSGSTDIQGGDFKVTDQNHNAEFDVDFFKVKTVSGAQFTGSVSSTGGFTGSLLGTASYATTADTASYVATALLTGSVSSNTLTFTKFDGSTFNLTVATGSAAAAFPFTGSAQITGSLGVTGSISTTGTIELTGTNKWINSVATGTPSAGQAQAVIAAGDPSINASAIASGIFAATNATIGANGYQSFILGGDEHDVNGIRTGVVGGYNNNVTVGNSYIFGGGYNDITGGNFPQVILGGNNINITNGTGTVGIGGLNNSIFGGDYNAILAGTGHTNSQNRSVIIGGQNITAAAADTVYVPNFVATGSATVQGNAVITGSLTTQGNAVITGSLTTVGTSTFRASTVFSGSVRGEVNALSITSNTASLDCSLDNFFTLTLVSGSNTFINPSNIQPGQTINLRVTQANPGNGTVSFPSSVKQISGSSYVPSVGAGPIDIITFISFDTSSLYLNNVQNFV